MDKNAQLSTTMTALERRIEALAVLADQQDPDALEGLLEQGLVIVMALMQALAAHAGRAMPVSDDALAVFKAFVKGDPSLNAIRDNVRELVFYRNCLNENRRDALPAAVEKMVLHTVKHVFFYISSRAQQEHRLD